MLLLDEKRIIMEQMLFTIKKWWFWGRTKMVSTTKSFDWKRNISKYNQFALSENL